MEFRLEMKILVTGSSGLIGTQLIKDLVEKKFDVYSSYHKIKPEFGKPIKMDISNEEEIINTLKKIKPNVIVHLAALTDVDKCENHKKLALSINARATKILSRESKNQEIFFIYLSTDYVFDGKFSYKKENDIPNPLNFYGKSKLLGEISIQDFNPKYLIIRISTPFGNHKLKKTFPIWVKENLELQKEISILNDQYTTPIFVPELTKMIIELMEKQITGIIHLAGTQRISRYDFALIIADQLKLDKKLLKVINLNEINFIAKRPNDSSLDISLAKKILNSKTSELKNNLKILFSNKL